MASPQRVHGCNDHDVTDDHHLHMFAGWDLYDLRYLHMQPFAGQVAQWIGCEMSVQGTIKRGAA